MAQAAVLARTREGTDLTLYGAVGLALVVVLSTLFAFGAVGLLALAGLAACIAAVVRPRLGVYAAIVMVFALSPLSGNPRFGDLAVRVNEPIPGLSLLPVEALILFASLGVLRVRLFTAGSTIRAGDLWLPLLAFVSVVAGAFLFGMSKGGDLRIAVWETRGIFLLVPIYYVVANVLTERRHFQILGMVAVAALLLAASETLYRHFTYVRGSYSLERPLDLAYTHESSIFVGLLALYFIARSLWGSSTWTSALWAALAILPIAALVVMRRRAGMIALDIGLLLFALALFRQSFTRFLIFVPLAVCVAAGLLAATWNEPGGLGQPARSVQEILGQNDDPANASSDDYRLRETNNVRANIEARPIQGLGFGRQYDFPNTLPDLEAFWPFFRYIPHNTVLWIWMKGGILAFAALLTLFAAASMRSAQLFRSFGDDGFRVVPLVAGAGVLMFAVFAYTDLGLVTSTAVFFFGLCMGLIGAAAEIEKRGFAGDSKEAA